MKISVVIPVYNASSYLHSCIESVLRQSFQDYEIILVNDGSTDDSLNICKKYAERYNNIILINEKNAGVSVARNRGIDIAKGDWITFVDADDMLLPDALNILWEREQATGADIVLANAIKLKDGKQTAPFLSLHNETFPYALYGIRHFALWGYLIKRETIMTNKLKFIEGLAYSEDRIFIYKLSGCCKTIAYSSKPVYVYRLNSTSACSSKNALRKAEHHFMAASHLKALSFEYYHSNDFKAYSLLKHESHHVVNLGIYQFVSLQPTWNEYKIMIKTFQKYLGTSLHSMVVMLYDLMKNYLTYKRRKIITFKKNI